MGVVEDNKLEHILNAIPSGIVILDENGIVSMANPLALQLLGEPLIQQTWNSIIARAFAPQKHDGFEISLTSGLLVKLAITPLLPGQLISITDLTETRLLQKNVARMEHLSSLGKMVANLAHQIRTPLTAALLYANNLTSNKLNNEVRDKFCKKLVDRLNDLERQVTDMLLTAKGAPTDNQKLESIDNIFKKLEESCFPIAQKAGVIIKFEAIDALIVADVITFCSALSNLIINSIEAKAKHIEIKSSLFQSNLIIEIIDDGCGVNAKTQAKIFEPFYTTKSQGTGLGLGVVQAVINKHSGKVALYSEEGLGCKITITLPVGDKNNG